MKDWRIVAVLLLCLVLAGTAACAGGGGDEVSWQETEVVRGDLTDSVGASGNIGVSDEANLTFGSSGKVDKLYVEEGDEVTKDDVLARLDTGPLELALTQAQAALAQAEYNLEKTEDPYSRDDIKTARAAVDAAEDYLEYAEWMLAQGGGLQGEEYWTAEVSRAWANLLAAEAQLEAMLDAPDKGAVDAAEAQLEAAEQALAEAQKQLDEATITAPFDGLVAGVYVKEGDIISSPTMTIIHLIDPSSMELNAEVDEIDIPDVKLGQGAIIEVDALPSLQLEGVVILIGSLPIVEAGLVIYEVKISFDTPEGSELKVGMSATTDIIIHQQSNVLLVPERAITQDNQGNDIVLVKIDDDIEERSVGIGISDGYQTEIVSGLEEGDVVVWQTKAKATESGGFF